MKPAILIGTHYHPGGPDALRRQQSARESLLRLEGVRLVNLQFAGGPLIECDGFETLAGMRNRRRFRRYVNSEAYWDPIYATIALCHARAVLLNREGLIRHEAHPRAWRESPFADYNRYLASLDTLYFSIWDKYKRRLLEL